jgi:hypothetical protein
MKSNVFLVLMLFAISSGAQSLKDITRSLNKNNAISKTFTRKEIKDLANLRVIIDNEIYKTTQEKDSKTAYEKYFQYLSNSKTPDEIRKKINIPCDSLEVKISKNNTFQEIWNITRLENNDIYLSLNRSGKIMDFFVNLSKGNPFYSKLLETIEITGDISPGMMLFHLKSPNPNLNLENDANKLFASIILVILCNNPCNQK